MNALLLTSLNNSKQNNTSSQLHLLTCFIEHTNSDVIVGKGRVQPLEPVLLDLQLRDLDVVVLQVLAEFA